MTPPKPSHHRRDASGDTRRDPRRTIFVGDVHGCRAEFEALLTAVAFTPGHDRLLLTGDAFTRGPDPLGVWLAIRATGAEMVLGNHETWLLPQLQAIVAGGSPDALEESRGPRLRELVPHAAELVAWLERLPLALDEPRFLLVHAGINPETGLAGSTPDELVAIRTWPPVGGIEGSRWHDHVVPWRQADRVRPRRPRRPGGKAPARRRPRRPTLPGRPRQRLRLRRPSQRLPAGGGPHRPGPGTPRRGRHTAVVAILNKISERAGITSTQTCATSLAVC